MSFMTKVPIFNHINTEVGYLKSIFSSNNSTVERKFLGVFHYAISFFLVTCSRHGRLTYTEGKSNRTFTQGFAYRQGFDYIHSIFAALLAELKI